jgi:hypothetical protein
VSELIKSRIKALGVSSKAARLKSLMPEIDRKVSEGVRHEDIVHALADEGLTVSLPTFRKNLYRYRKVPRALEPEPEKVEGIVAVLNNPQITPPLISDGDFEAALDPRSRDKLADQYLTRRKPIMRNKV